MVTEPAGAGLSSWGSEPGVVQQRTRRGFAGAEEESFRFSVDVVVPPRLACRPRGSPLLAPNQSGLPQSDDVPKTGA